MLTNKACGRVKHIVRKRFGLPIGLKMSVTVAPSLLCCREVSGSSTLNSTMKHHHTSNSESLLLRTTTVPLDNNSASSQQQHITLLELNRPSNGNALSFELLQQIEQELLVCDSNYPDCRVVILAATPNKSNIFCAGHDLNELQQCIRNKDEAAIRELFDTCRRVTLLLQQIRPVTIAQVHGVVTAAGCQLVSACDLAVACESAKFALSGISVGLVCSTPVVPLFHKAIPFQKKVLEMLLTGDFCNAADAERLGIVNRVVPAGSVMSIHDETIALARRIARHSSYASARGKEMFHHQTGLDYEEALQYATDRIVEDICSSEDASAGIDAFSNKREPPKWKGR